MIHLFNFAFSVWNAVFRGLVIKFFWAWFLVSQFPGLPTIQVLPAIGFSYLVAVLSPYKPYTLEEWEAAIKRSEDKSGAILGALNGVAYFVGLLALLAFGWIVHRLMIG